MELGLFINYQESDLPDPVWSRIKQVIANVKIGERDDLSGDISNAEAIFLKLGDSFLAEDLNLAPNLKLIGMLGTGYGKIDVAAARERGVSVFNIADYATDAVAEFVFATLLRVTRDLRQAENEIDNGNYVEGDFMASELRGKTLGIIGLGNIGQRVATIATKGFGMDLSYWSKNPKEGFSGYADIKTVLESADVLSFHVALTPETNEMIGEKELSFIKEGALVINTAPMEILSMPALKKAAQENRFQFILDHSDEMDTEDVVFFNKLDNCYVYPPIAYLTEQAGQKKFDLFAENIDQYVKNGKMPNLVN